MYSLLWSCTRAHYNTRCAVLATDKHDKVRRKAASTPACCLQTTSRPVVLRDVDSVRLLFSNLSSFSLSIHLLSELYASHYLSCSISSRSSISFFHLVSPSRSSIAFFHRVPSRSPISLPTRRSTSSMPGTTVVEKQVRFDVEPRPSPPPGRSLRSKTRKVSTSR
jgi:hypothetical protein